MSVTEEDVDALLPQTQCGLCGYKGCLPYAKAIAKNEAPINLCLPGGRRVLNQLAHLLKQDAAHLHIEAKPPQVAVIDEQQCIGCTKCIMHCPVDAIIGSAKKMHTVITEFCTGCELCIEPCPVDCITMLDSEESNDEIFYAKANVAKKRYERRNSRLALEHQKKKKSHQDATKVIAEKTDKQSRQKFIAEAVARAKAKKQSEG